MKPCGVQHPWEFGCSWYFAGWDCSVSCWGARLYFNINSVVMHLFLCAVLKGKKNQGRQPVAWASVGTSFPLASRFLLFFSFSCSKGTWAVCLLHNSRGALPSSAPAERQGLLFASEGSQKLGWVALTVGCESWRDCSLQRLPYDLEASWDSMGLPLGHSLLCEWGKRGTWLCRLHVGGPPQPHWNTMAAPDSACSHTVLAHWKSHKTWVVQGSQAVHEVFLTFAGSHTMNVVSSLLKKENVITLN